MCGIVVVYSVNGDTSRTIPMAIGASKYVKHRGQQGAGVCVITPEGTVMHHSGVGAFDAVIKPTDIEKMGRDHRLAMVQCRWGTYGGYHENNVQPIVVNSSNDIPVCVVHNGQFILMPDLLSQRDLTDDIESDTLLFARLLARYSGNDWDSHVVSVLSKTLGAYSLAISIHDVLFLTRDSYGVRPLYLGSLDGAYIAASETQAITAIGGTIIREIGCGEILKIDTSGLHVLVKGNGHQRHVCEFESAYLCRPDSMMQSFNGNRSLFHARFRFELGEAVALESPVKHAKMVVGVPDSGMFFDRYPLN